MFDCHPVGMDADVNAAHPVTPPPPPDRITLPSSQPPPIIYSALDNKNPSSPRLLSLVVGVAGPRPPPPPPTRPFHLCCARTPRSVVARRRVPSGGRPRVFFLVSCLSPRLAPLVLSRGAAALRLKVGAVDRRLAPAVAWRAIEAVLG